MYNVLLNYWDLSNNTLEFSDELSGMGSTKNSASWIFSDSQGNTYISGFEQLGFIEFSCSVCLPLKAPYIMKFNNIGDLEWRFLFKEENRIFGNEKTLYAVDNIGHPWMITSRFSVEGNIIEIFQINEKGELLWEKEIAHDASLVDFKIDQSNSAWILYNTLSNLFILRVDKNGNLLWVKEIDQVNDYNSLSFDLIMDESSVSCLLFSLNNLQDEYSIFKIIDDGKSLWNQKIKIGNNKGLVDIIRNYDYENEKLNILNGDNITIIDGESGKVDLQKPHYLNLFNENNDDQEFLIDFRYKEEHLNVITQKRLVTLDLNGRIIKSIDLPRMEFGFDYFDSYDNLYLIANTIGDFIIGSYDFENFSFFPGQQTFEFEGYENLEFSIRDVFISNQTFSILGEFDRISFAGFPVRQFCSFFPIAIKGELNPIISSTAIIEKTHNLFSIYPNPLEGNSVNISFKDPLFSLNSLFIRISSIEGKLLFSNLVQPTTFRQNMKLDIPYHIIETPGVYIITIDSSRGSWSKKLVIF